MSGWQFILMNLQILAMRKFDSCQKQLVIMSETGNFFHCRKYRNVTARHWLHHDVMFIKKVSEHMVKSPISKSDS